MQAFWCRLAGWQIQQEHQPNKLNTNEIERHKGFDGVDPTYEEEGGHESGCEIMYPQEGVAPIVTPWRPKPCSCYYRP